MSPEQLQGKEADARSDIFAFGCVLYEMMGGRMAFPGSTAPSVIAAILEREPEPLKTIPALERVIRTCLEKDPDKRIQNALDLKRDLVWAMETGAIGSTVAATPAKSLMPSVIVAAVMAVVAAVALWAPWRSDKPADLPMTRFSVDLGPDAVRGARVTAVLSPDGTRLVFTGRAEGELVQLFTRRVDQAQAVALEGTAAADTSYPFFSRDGKWIGFIADGKIRKVAAQGARLPLSETLPKSTSG
jgi:serine/threonine-protein kinase